MLVKEKIASLRRMLGLSSSELAEKIGVTQSTISRYEKGYVRIMWYDRASCNVEALLILAMSCLSDCFILSLPSQHSRSCTGTYNLLC